MIRSRWTAVVLAGLLAVGLSPADVRAAAPPVGPSGNDDASVKPPEAPFFRVFLKDGTSLVSYGEVAQVGERVVFSMPTAASLVSPDLKLINIPAGAVDWDRTSLYAESARAARYFSIQAEIDYAQLSSTVAQALNDVATTNDPAKRLTIVERARKTLAEWPPRHYNYKQDDVRQMLSML